GRLLRSELDTPFSRPTLHRLHEASAGNPFLALEIARALARRGETRPPPGPLPVPATLADLVRERLADLPEPTRAALVIVAAAARPTVELVAAALGEDAWPALRPALAAAVLDVHGERLAFAHPLLASAVYGDADPGRLRWAHSALSA